jgi:DNA polymerase-3 subunit gamma/tau
MSDSHEQIGDESDEASFGLGLEEPPQPAKAAAAAPYRVLARKYRPQSFGELVGQDAMVQTLGNAIRRASSPRR